MTNASRRGLFVKVSSHGDVQVLRGVELYLGNDAGGRISGDRDLSTSFLGLATRLLDSPFGCKAGVVNLFWSWRPCLLSRERGTSETDVVSTLPRCRATTVENEL
jgi:hypothetical protein